MPCALNISKAATFNEIANDRQALTFTIEIDGELQEVTMTGRHDYTGRSRKSVIFVGVENETVAEIGRAHV